MRPYSPATLRLAWMTHHDGDVVRTEHFGENEDEDHADEQPWLLGRASDTSISNDPDREARTT